MADTRLVPAAERAEQLRRLRALFQGELPASERAPLLAELAQVPQSDDAIEEERLLLGELGGCLDALEALPGVERALTRRVLATLTSGMRDDLLRFGDSSEELDALETRAELLHYCYQVAGCVGEFWSRIHAARLPRLRRRVVSELEPWIAAGLRLGRALQLTNVLRDVRRDLQHGRCYLPREELSALGLAPRDMLDPACWPRLRPLYASLIAQALADAWAGVRYTQRIPGGEVGLRLAGLLPLLLCVRTLGAVYAGNPLEAPAKVSRKVVYSCLGGGLLAGRDARQLEGLYRGAVNASGLEQLAPRR